MWGGNENSSIDGDSGTDNSEAGSWGRYYGYQVGCVCVSVMNGGWSK